MNVTTNPVLPYSMERNPDVLTSLQLSITATSHNTIVFMNILYEQFRSAGFYVGSNSVMHTGYGGEQTELSLW